MLLPRSAILSAIPALVAILAMPAAAQQTTNANSALVTVSGTVYDSLSGRSLPDALVQLAARDARSGLLSARTGADGSFRIPGVAHGEYLVGFTHPFLDSLGLEIPPLKLAVDGSAHLRLALAIPTPLAVRAQLCPAAQPTDSSGLLLGYLRDADTGEHLDSGSVQLEWTEVAVTRNGKGVTARQRSATASATSAGWYAMCGVPTAGPTAARAEMGSNASGYIDIKVPPRGVLHRDFLVPTASSTIATADSGGHPSGERARHGSARLVGVVRSASGKLLGGAHLRLLGSDITASAGDDGTFALATLPAGTWTLEVRHIGYAARRIAVDLMSNRTASATVTLDKVADVLDEVTVYGEQRTLSNKLAGFRQRKRLGFGHFITRAEIKKRAPLRLTSLLRGIPGIAVTPDGPLSYRVASSRPWECAPVVYLDGHRVDDFVPIDDLVWLDDVVAVEVYSTAAFVPGEFRTTSNCGGSIVVWTSPDASTLDRVSESTDKSQ